MSRSVASTDCEKVKYTDGLQCHLCQYLACRNNEGIIPCRCKLRQCGSLYLVDRRKWRWYVALLNRSLGGINSDYVSLGIVSTCLPTLRPLYAIAVRGHYCRSNDHCSRCERSAKGMNNLQPWNSASTVGRQGSDESKLANSYLPNNNIANTQGQWSMAGVQDRQVKVFSIMDRPL